MAIGGKSLILIPEEEKTRRRGEERFGIEKDELFPFRFQLRSLLFPPRLAFPLLRIGFLPEVSFVWSCTIPTPDFLLDSNIFEWLVLEANLFFF
jgi:hypothetical protein